MNLVIDIGNTRTKTALFSGGKLNDPQVHGGYDRKIIIQRLTNHPVQKVIFSVTGSLAAKDRNWLCSEIKAIELTERTPLPLTVHYRTPETLGKDRIAAVVGAWSFYPDHPLLVVDAGTCITYDYLVPAGHYLGGNIAPGLRMRLRAMHTFTARLPEVEPAPLGSPIGRSTETALRNGALWGALQEFEGYIRYGRKEFGSLKIVLTGGDADFFANHLKRRIFVRPELVLIGLNKILEFNE